MPRAPAPTSCVGQATSSSLLERAKARDHNAWRQLVELYGPLVFHWCLRAGLAADDAADVVQEVFRAVVANIERFDRSSHSGNFRGWLVTMTTNKVRDFARQKAKQPVGAGGTDDQQFLADAPEEVETADTRASGNVVLARCALELVAAEFEQGTWKAFWQTTVESKPTDEVGHQLGMTAIAVCKAKSRVLRRLREVLAGEV